MRARPTGCFRNRLDGDDGDLTPRCHYKTFHVVQVAGENHRVLAKGDSDNNGVDDIGSSALAKQSSCFVRLAFIQRNDCAASQKPPELDLF